MEELAHTGRIPTFDQGAIPKMRTGAIRVINGNQRPIEGFAEDGMRLGGDAERFDDVILATGFEPRLDELLGVPELLGPVLWWECYRNSGLGPEILQIGGELGTDLRYGPLRLRLTGFWNELEDTIAFVTVTPFPNLSFRRENVAATRSRGFEVEGELKLFEVLSLMPSYTYLDSTIERFGPDPSREGNQLPNVPAHTVGFTVRYDAPRWLTVSVRGRHLSRRYVDDRHTQPLDSHSVMDVAVSRRFLEHWEVYLQASNLFDETHLAGQTGSVGTLGAPTQVWGGLRFDW